MFVVILSYTLSDNIGEIKNIPSTTYGFEALTEQTKEVKFTEHDMAIVQGLSG